MAIGTNTSCVELHSGIFTLHLHNKLDLDNERYTLILQTKAMRLRVIV